MSLGAIAASSSIPACSAGFVRSHPDSAERVSWIEARGDWNDLDAAMEVAASKVESAVVTREDLPGGVSRFTLVTSTDEDGWLRATALAPITPATLPMRLEARFGATGDSARESRLLEALRARLEQLAGKDWAPMQ